MFLLAGFVNKKSVTPPLTVAPPGFLPMNLNQNWFTMHLRFVLNLCIPRHWDWATQTTTETSLCPLSYKRATVEQHISSPFHIRAGALFWLSATFIPVIFFSRYVITPACVVMLHMGRPIAALFVQAHNWTAVIWLPASAKASTYCPHSPAADDVRAWFP